MSDPFGDLDETLDDTGGAASDTPEATSGAERDETDGETQAVSGAATSGESVTGDESGDGDTPDDEPLSSPAFPFAEAEQTAVYPRAETWATFEDFLDFEVRRRLREAGVRDDTKRELHEAALQVVQSHPEAVAEQFLANRRDTE